MSGVLDGMKLNDDKREQELSGLKTDIDNIKTMIPQVTKDHLQTFCLCIAIALELTSHTFFVLEPLFIQMKILAAGEEQGIPG